MNRVREVASDIADDAAAGLDCQYEAIGLVGDLAERIVEYGNEQVAWYIVVAGRKPSPAGKMMFFSCSESQLGTCLCVER